jgi:tRNA threonylcarbamoyladenosine biosynthesis protein TsaE
MKIVSKSESATVEAGRKLGRRLEEPRIILLCGELGAGKTAFTRGLATGLGLADASLVHSPTFSLINQYAIRSGTLYHIDLYRLDHSRDFYSIGLDELLDGDRFVVIEWAEKLTWSAPNPLRVTFEVVSDTERLIRIEEGIEEEKSRIDG